MSEHRGEHRGERRVTVGEAAELLGISKDAVRMRVRRGTLRHEKTEGRMHVWVDTDQGADQNAVHPGVPRELVEELRDRVRFLEGQLEQANERDRENRRIVAALTSRIPELEAPGAPETAEEEPERVEPRPDAPGAQEAAQRPWWRRVFGG